MIDSFTKVIYGWKVDDKKEVRHLSKELDTICEDVYNKDMYSIPDNFVIEDVMCGNYLYFGSILASWDNDSDNKSAAIDNELIAKEYGQYALLLEQYPQIAKVLKKYSKKQPPQLYVMLHKY